MAMPLRIVVVEDVPDLAASIARTLRLARFEVHVAGDASAGLELARSLPAELVLLDVSSPGMDAVQACRRLRTFSDAYVIMLTARSGETDRLAGLAAGADDYMTKPFYPRELVARIRAMQRRPRSREAPPRVRRFGELEIELDTQRVRVGETAVTLSQIEYRLLEALSAQPTETLTREQLLRRVWGAGWSGGDHLIDVHVSNLRRKLGDDAHDPHYVTTVRGWGFRMGQA